MAVGARGAERREAVVDHHAEVALEHLIDGGSFQAPEQIGIIAGQLSGQDVPREDHGSTVRRTDPVHDHDVLPASSAEAASVRAVPWSVPGSIPEARIASVTPKFASKLFATRGRSATKVPEPRARRTSPSSSTERRASRRGALETPSSAASSGSGGS